MNTPTVKSSPKSNFIPELQILRAFAASIVILFHIPGAFAHISKPISLELSFFQIGVDIFFVISGFVMIHVERREGINALFDFLIRRLLRIAPMYWIFTTCALIFYIYEYFGGNFFTFGYRRVISSYLFWPHGNSISDKSDYTPIYNIGWTLNYEIFFYLVFALTMFFNVRYRLILVTVFLSALIIIGQLFELELPWYFWSNPITGEFLLGMVVAVVFRNTGYIGAYKVYSIMTISIISFFAAECYRSEIIDWMDSYSDFWRLSLWGIPSSIFVFSVVSMRLEFNTLVLRFIKFVGDASYSIYLCHYLLLDLMAIFVSHQSFLLNSNKQLFIIVSIMWIVTIFCGIVLHVAIERYLQKHLRGIGYSFLNAAFEYLRSPLIRLRTTASSK